MAQEKHQFIYLYKVNLNNKELTQTPEYVFCYSTAQITMNFNNLFFTLNQLSDRTNIQSGQVEYYSIHLKPDVTVTCYDISGNDPENKTNFNISDDTKDAETIRVFLVPIDNFPTQESESNDNNNVCTHYLKCYYTYGEIYYNNSIINSTDPIYEFDININNNDNNDNNDNNKCQQLFNDLMMRALSQIQTFQNMYNELVKNNANDFYKLLDDVNEKILGDESKTDRGNEKPVNTNDKNLSDKIRDFSNTINKLFSKKSILSLNWMEPNTMKTTLYELASGLNGKNLQQHFNGLDFYKNIIFLFYVNLSFISKNVPVAKANESISDDNRRLRLNQIHKDIFDYYAGFNTTDRFFKVKHDTSMFVDHSNYYNQLASKKNDNFEKYTTDMKTTKSIHILDFCNVMSSIKSPDDETKNYNLYEPIMKITLQHLVDNKDMFKAIIDAKLEAPRVGGMISYLKITNFAETSTTGIANYNERFKIQLNDLSRPTAVLVNYLNDGFSYYSNRTESRQINDANLDILREKYVFGNFDRVFDPKQQNKVIANDMTQVNSELDNGKPVMIIGYGASGSGKTSSLINYYDSNSKKSTDGILIDLCKRYALYYPTFELTIQEIFQTDEPMPDSLNGKSNEESKSGEGEGEGEGGEGDSIWHVHVETPKNTPGIYQYTIKNEKPFIFQYENGEITLNNNNQYDIRHRYNRHMFIQGFFEPNSDTSVKGTNGKPIEYAVEQKPIKNNGNDETMYVAKRRQTLKEGIQLGEAIRLMVDIDRYTKATTNNPQSSRSHCIVYIKMKNNSDNSDFKTLIIGDFAGVENTFDDKDYKTAEKMIGIKHQYSTQKYIQQNIGKTDQGSKSQNVSNYLHNFDYDDNNVSKYDYMYGGATIAEVKEDVTFDESYIKTYFEVTNNKVNNGIYDVNQLNAPYKTIYGDSKSGNTLLSRIVSNNSDNNDNNNNTAPTYSYKYVNKYDEYKNTNYHFSFDDFFNEYVGTDVSATRVIRQMLTDVGLSGLDFDNIFPKKIVGVVAQEVSKKGGEGSDDEMTGGDSVREFENYLKTKKLDKVPVDTTELKGIFNNPTKNDVQYYTTYFNGSTEISKFNGSTEISKNNALNNLYTKHGKDSKYTTYLSDQKTKQSTMFRQQPESPRVSTPSVQNKSPQQSNTQTAQQSPLPKATTVTSPRKDPQRVPRVPIPPKTTEKYSKIHEYLYSVATVPQEEGQKGQKGLQALLGIQENGPFHQLLKNINRYYNIKSGVYLGPDVAKKLDFIKSQMQINTNDDVQKKYADYILSLNVIDYFKYPPNDSYKDYGELMAESNKRLSYIKRFLRCDTQPASCYDSSLKTMYTHVVSNENTNVRINNNNDISIVSNYIQMIIYFFKKIDIKKDKSEPDYSVRIKNSIYDIFHLIIEDNDPNMKIKRIIIENFAFIINAAHDIIFSSDISVTKTNPINITDKAISKNMFGNFSAISDPDKRNVAVSLKSWFNQLNLQCDNVKNIFKFLCHDIETIITSTMKVHGPGTYDDPKALKTAILNSFTNPRDMLPSSIGSFANKIFRVAAVLFYDEATTTFNTNNIVKDRVEKYFKDKQTYENVKEIEIKLTDVDEASKIYCKTIENWKPVGIKNASPSDSFKYYLIVVTELFRHLIRIKLAYVLLKDAIKRRNLEGAFINNSLTELANDLKTIFNHKTKRLTNAFPSMIEECIDYYVPPKIYDSVAIDLLKTETTTKEPLSVIMKCVNKWLTSQSTPSTQSSQSTQSTPSYLDLTICLFCVLNISRVANDPPPVPYINANKVIRQFNEGIIQKSDWDALVQMIKDYQLDNLLIRESTNKYPPISFNNSNNTFNVATANQELNKQIKWFFDRIHKHNQSSAIGTVDFVDKLVKLNKVENVCVIDKDETKFDKLFETPYPDVRAPKK